MSLLMDALKRAEKARQSDADSPEPRTDPEETHGGLSLDPIEIEDPPGPPVLGESDPATNESGTVGGTDTDLLGGFDDSGLTLNVGPEPTSQLEAPPTIDGPVAGAVAGAERGGADDPMRLPPEDTSATLPSIKAAQESVEDYFDGTRSISMSMGSVDGAISEDTVTGERSTVDTSRRQRARAMFDAKAARRQRTSWAAVLLIPLVVLALLAGGGFYFWDTLIATFVGGPTVASLPTPTTPPPPEPDSITVVQADTQVVPEVTASASTGETASTVATTSASSSAESTQSTSSAVLTSAATDGQTMASDSDGASSEVATEIAAGGQVDEVADVVASGTVPTTGNFSATPTPSVQVVEAAPETEEFEVALAELEIPPDMTITEALAGAIEAAGLQPEGSIGAIGIKITRKSQPARVNPLLSEGYEAFNNGDMAAADQAYRRVLRQQPRNRDAMLGLAAIAMAGGQWQQASAAYAELLRLDPNDSVAQAAIISLHDDIDPLASETKIKNMLRDAPDSAHLHFSLGNVFADQARWSEAQAAFFDAHRLDNDNADYAFNLAVSLDRLIQRAAALDYYRLALDLADRGVAGFRIDAVLRRIQTMTTADAGQ